MKFVFRIVEDSDAGGPSSIAVQTESLFTIFVPIPTRKLCLKNDEGRQNGLLNEGNEGEKVYMKKKWRKIYDPFKIPSLSR